MAFVDNGKDAAGRQDIDFTFARGDTIGIQVTLTDGTDPINLTGASVKLTVNTEQEPADATNEVFELTGNITDAVNGVVEFVPSIAQATQTPAEYFYDVQVTLASGRIVSALAGSWTYVADIKDPAE